MNKIIGVLLVAGGVILLITGINASDSLGSEFKEFFTGSPTNEAVWMMIGGGAAAIVGLALVLRGRPVTA